MKIGEIRDLIRLKPIELSAPARRLSTCHDIDDLRRAARRAVPRPVFDYVDGGADEEVSLAANRQAFQRHRFQPNALAGVAGISTTAGLFGAELAFPLVLGPTGYTRMMHPAGEIAVAGAAHRHGLPYTLSTMATTTIEALAGAVPHQDLWFQLYVMRDAGLNKELVARAAAAGYRTLMITVDTVVPGHRTRDERNGLIIPPALTASALANIAVRPGYWLRMLRNPAIEFANIPLQAKTIAGSASLFDPAVTWDVVETLRDAWPGKLLLKGPLSPSDCQNAVQRGADGILLSNHGGRQLDRAVAPIDLVAGARDALGPDATIIVDSGVRHGADIAVALALGANAAAIGRAYLYGLMAAGEPGVDHAIDLLSEQFTRTLQLLGMRSVTELRERGAELIR
ncbi:MAG TPA: alpha-hydroxy acid oxidase [Streptosporangiaceae bacterium]|nr:alpha-hydroxy acid oxidase [Streptosporangiaceae bacterium]